jgi:hypothetical protein
MAADAFADGINYSKEIGSAPPRLSARGRVTSDRSWEIAANGQNASVAARR